MQFDGFSLVLLGAGLSSRFGANKLLQTLNGKKLAEYAFSLSQYFKNTFLVYGNDYKKLLAISKKYSIEAVYNSNYKTGINSSIKKGLKAVKENKLDTNVIILPCDMPLITTKHIQKLVKQWNLISVCSLMRPLPSKSLDISEPFGFPVLLNKDCIEDFLSYKGCLKGFGKNKLHPFMTSKQAYFSDIDYLSDLEHFKKQLANN